MANNAYPPTFRAPWLPSRAERLAAFRVEQERYNPRPANRWRANDPDWRALRAQHLREEPMCHRCAQLGQETIATVVDHIQPLRTHPEPDGSIGLIFNRYVFFIIKAKRNASAGFERWKISGTGGGVRKFRVSPCGRPRKASFFACKFLAKKPPRGSLMGWDAGVHRRSQPRCSDCRARSSLHAMPAGATRRRPAIWPASRHRHGCPRRSGSYGPRYCSMPLAGCSTASIGRCSPGLHRGGGPARQGDRGPAQAG